MKSSKCMVRSGVSFTGDLDKYSEKEAGRRPSFGSGRPPRARIASLARTRQWLGLFVFALVSAVIIVSMPFSASGQLSPELREALDYHKAGKLKEAIDVYSEAITKDPKSAEAYDWRGMAYEDLGEMDKALADFNKAIEISDNYADAYNNRGEIYRKQKKFPEAMNDYRKAAELEKDFAEPHFNMGLILESQKRADQAVREFEIYLRLKPDALDKQKILSKVEALKKLAATAPGAPQAPGTQAPPAAAPGAPAPPSPAPTPPQAKPGVPAVPKPLGPRPGPAVPIPPPGVDLGIPGVPPITPDMLAGLDVASGIISLVGYLFTAIMIFLIARKTNTALPWLAFIPIAQFILMINIARKPLWWLILFLAPILVIPLALAGPMDPTGGIIIAVLSLLLVLVPLLAWLFVCIGMSAQRGKSIVWGILTFIPCTSPIGLAYLGLSK